MSQLLRALGLGILAIALLVGVGISGDTKKDKEKKASIPPGWAALKLTKEQHDKIVGIGTAFNAKIAALELQITELKAQRRAEQVKLLTDGQKAILLQGITGEEKDKAPAKDSDKKDVKDKAPAKDSDKDKKDGKDKDKDK